MRRHRHHLGIPSIQDEHATTRCVKSDALRISHVQCTGRKTSAGTICFDLCQLCSTAVEHEQAVRDFIEGCVQGVCSHLRDLPCARGFFLHRDQGHVGSPI